MPKNLKKIYFFIYSYLPGANSGGPIVSIKNILDVLPNECFVITHNKDVAGNKKYDQNELLKNSLKRKFFYKTPGIESIVFFLQTIFKIEKNSIFYFSSFFRFSHTFIPLFILRIFHLFGFKRKTKIIISPRNEFSKESLSFKSYKKILYIIFFKLFFGRKITYHATNTNEIEDISRVLRIKSKNINLVKNINPSSLTLNKVKFFPKRVNKTKLLFAGRIAKDKNIHFINEILKNAHDKPNIVVDLWGPIRDPEYLNSLLSKASYYEINLNYCGVFVDSQKSNIYQNYHAFLFPALSENYSHVIGEALSHGLPVITSDNTPWETNLNFFDTGLVNIKLSCANKYLDSIYKIHIMNKAEHNEIRSNTLKFYSRIADNKRIIEDTKNLFK